MEDIPQIITKTYHIKNMVSNCCIMLLGEKFVHAGIRVDELKLGLATLTYDPDFISESQIKQILLNYGFDFITSHDKKIVEQVKIAVIELIHHLNNVDSIVRKSDYLVEKLGKSYQYLSKVFSTHEGITLEKFIILQKIERIKELIHHKEYTLSKITYMIDYNNVQYLSNQFKKITGLSATEFRNNEIPMKKSIDRLY